LFVSFHPARNKKIIIFSYPFPAGLHSTSINKKFFNGRFTPLSLNPKLIALLSLEDCEVKNFLRVGVTPMPLKQKLTASN
jgi:hypothetical protein